MATIEQLQRIRIILTILIIIDSLAMVPVFYFVDDFYYFIGINMFICFCLVVAITITQYKLRRLLIQQGLIVGRLVVVHQPNGQVQPPPGGPPPPPPGFVPSATGLPQAYSPSAPAPGSDPPPSYSQTGAWTTQQSGAGFSQPSAYSQSAFNQPPAAGGQPFAAFNQPGQNAYWNPAQTK